MKSKKIIAAIACCFCGSVYASDVSVYGMVDAYVPVSYTHLTLPTILRV